MTAAKLHHDEVDIDAALVRRLLEAQLPQFAGEAIALVPSTGTVNAIFRVGNDLYARLPRVERYAGDLMKELEWLPRLARHVPLAVPSPVAAGEPGCGYPFAWAVYRWLDGEPYTADDITDERAAATDLANFVTELRRLDTADAPRSGRAPLAVLDAVTRAAIDALPPACAIDPAAVREAWHRALRAPEWDGTACWRHCDLLPPNVLVADGRLHAIIDWGGAGIGDPAIDLIPAWTMFGRAGRAPYRDRLDADDGAWDRARGVALHQALLIIPYYVDTNPAFAAMAVRTVGAVLDDLALNG